MLTPDQLTQIKSLASGGANPITANKVMTPEEAKSSFQAVSQNTPEKGGLLKSMVSAPATMIARPLQAAQSAGQVLGADNQGLEKASAEGNQLQLQLMKVIQEGKAQGKDMSHAEKTLNDVRNQPDIATQQINENTNYKPTIGANSNGIIAEAPTTGADIKKDIGRGIQTVALGAAGPVTGGAAFGLGSSLEEGNKLLSAKTAFDTALGGVGGKVLELVGKPIFNVAGKVIGKITPQYLQDLAGKGTQAIQDFAAQHEILPEKVSNAINKGTEGTEASISKPIENVANRIKEGASTLKESTLGKAQTALSRGSVSENLGTSIDRLQEKSATKNPETGLSEKGQTPLEKYDEFYKQEKAYKNDVKKDTALAKVGSETGKAYDKVIKMRQTAGKSMSEEMKKVGNIKTDISHAFTPLEEELNNNGLIYDAEKGKLKASKTSKMTNDDTKLLQDYIGKINNLGSNPSAAELDAFLSKTPAELDVYKNKNNITKVTNGERIIKGNLNSLKESLSEKSNPAFKGYSDAKKQYADLTKFLDEGSSFLGKKTASGDYAKDASMAKSSVQSVLNNGKKDWLLKLEDLTGYPAMDESMLALQAMKDAGNPQGHSLLELVTKGSTPTSAHGAIAKGVEWGIEKGKKALIGTPNQQTRRMIQERMGLNK